jgi:hypothetical protein
MDWHRLLPLEGDVAQVELMAQGFLVNLLHQAGAVITMDLDGRTDDQAGDFVLVHRW